MPRYIDAEKIDFGKVFGGESDFARDIRDAANFLISEVPTEDVAPVIHAHWIEKEQVEKYATRFPTIYSMLLYCSNCGESNGRRISNYCPRCGAKMDAEKSDD